MQTTVNSTNQAYQQHLEKAQQVVQQFKSKARDDRYTGCFVFGSFADGSFTQFSDLDIVLVVKDEDHTQEYQSLQIEDINVDLSVETLEQVKKREEEILTKAERRTWLSDALILFSDDGSNLDSLKAYYSALSKPKSISPEDTSLFKKNIEKMNQKIEQASLLDQDNCQFTMLTCIRELVNIYYRASGRFTVQAKKLFIDLDKWDKQFADSLRGFLYATNLENRIGYWHQLVGLIANKLNWQLTKEKIIETNYEPNFTIS